MTKGRFQDGKLSRVDIDLEAQRRHVCHRHISRRLFFSLMEEDQPSVIPPFSPHIDNFLHALHASQVIGALQKLTFNFHK